MEMTETMHRIRTHVAGVAVLLGLLTVAAEPGHSPLLIGVALVAALLVIAANHLLLMPVVVRCSVGPHRARAPGVVLTSTHPDAAGHARPRAPGAGMVTLA
ncbi:DUF6412 domain-containing protein [Flexivirga oryzae]|uniref:Uncharacterized protein n=1 Tax=Flexivirga oryzae TaxID=1794944 RepID=A0A839N689_9MICO|nr:DUF6412 domain-containing protein [Flexivirga oryzae]MBB2893260.1 hypothetical protein [Flexivirga oryzae]